MKVERPKADDASSAGRRHPHARMSPTKTQLVAVATVLAFVSLDGESCPGWLRNRPLIPEIVDVTHATKFVIDTHGLLKKAA